MGLQLGLRSPGERTINADGKQRDRSYGEEGLGFYSILQMSMKIIGFLSGLRWGSFPLAKELDQEGLQA